MTARTFRTRVLLVGSGLAEADLGDKDVTISVILEQGVHTGFYALFDHDRQTVSGTVADISPPDWEATGATPDSVRVNRSGGG